AFEIAFSQQFQRANPLAGSIFGELFFEISRNSCGHAISGQTLVSGAVCITATFHLAAFEVPFAKWPRKDWIFR
ncbi:hypothetical protein, partial [Rubripirellula tenax]|uniref:hypothetical protein n=1 Tax=Rubripirellula tenax TaxID=2528015 RepID=UPI001C948957